MSLSKRVTRRALLKGAAAAAAAPWFVPASALGQTGRPAASNRITLAVIGGGHGGGMGTSNMNAFLGLNDVQIVAVCDVDKSHREQARQRVNNHYGNSDCRMYADFRELMERRDIDAVSIATPDHWHALIAIAAAKSGKDIYGEKPLSHTLTEGRAMVQAVERHGRIWQTGSWQRSQANFRQGAELVRNGRIGKVHTIEVGLPVDGTVFKDVPSKPVDPPSHLDWDMWLGPAPVAPYQPERVHFTWRWNLDYGGGSLMDWIGHHGDIAHWGMDWDHTGPIEVEGHGEFQNKGIYNTAGRYRITCKYRDGVTMIIGGNQPDIRNGTRWIGTDGWVHVDRGSISANPQSLLQEKIGPNEINLYRSPGHHRNFIDCIKSRQPTLTPAETAHRAATPGHLGQIAMLLGRKIRFDPEKEAIIGDETASRMLTNPLRSPWAL